MRNHMNRSSKSNSGFPGRGEGQDGIEFHLTTGADDDRPVFLVGSFNNWDLRKGAIACHRVRPGVYRCFLPRVVQGAFPLEYKYLKGSWDDIELDAFGNFTENRQVQAPVKEVQDHVPNWLKNGRIYEERYLPGIEIISEEFEIPQLIKTRRIAAILPHDYHRSDKSYPVLYLQDGQNLFDEFAPFGTWGVDKRLALMARKKHHELIVIAIDHAEDQRIEEYTPSHETRLGVGDGKKYVRFLADTLKPFVDKHFRTLPGREHTGIGGSSMGALVSLYAGLLYPEVYSKLLVFSPSLWVDPDLLKKTPVFPDHVGMRTYLYAGVKEGTALISHTLRLKQRLEGLEKEGMRFDINLSINQRGEHSEKYWGREFYKAISWLYFEP